MARYCAAAAAVLAAVLLAAPPGLARADEPPGDPLLDVQDRPLDKVEPTDQWVRRLADLFLRGALRDELGRDRPVTRWPGPITLTVHGDASRDLMPHVLEVADEVSHASGIPIEVLERPLMMGDITVMVTWRKGYWPFFAAPIDPNDTAFTCMAMPSSRDGLMVRSGVHVNVGNVGPEVAKACVLEEVLQSMGLFGEVDDRATALNDEVGYQHLGEVDILLLRALYDPRLKAGSEGPEAAAAAHAILAELVAAGVSARPTALAD